MPHELIEKPGADSDLLRRQEGTEGDAWIAAEGVNKDRLPRIQIRVTKEFDRVVKVAVAKAGIKQEQWVIAVIAEALRGQVGPTLETGPLAALPGTDRQRADCFIKFLRRNPEEIKDAVMRLLPVFERLRRQG